MANMVSHQPLYFAAKTHDASGLRTRKIHDKVLRSELPRISWGSPSPQSPLDLPRYFPSPLSVSPLLTPCLGIWKIIKGWLDPVVASKVHFTNNNEEMESYVPKPQIISELGGHEDWTYKYLEPVPGENDTMKDTETRDKLLAARAEIVKEYETATLQWIHGTGDVEGVKKKRNEIAGKLKVDYWGLDPYIRARSYYDRVGMINPGGRIQFYPAKEEEKIAPVPESVPAGAEEIPAPVATSNRTAKTVETSEADLD